jgi:5-bromo-4-chloroindolyl phosphate hydrolysis protein
MSKAKRYNPDIDTKNRFSGKLGNFLYIFLAPLFVAIVMSLLMLETKAFIMNIIAFSLFFATARASGMGLKQEQEYYTTTLTKAPKTPYKAIAGILLGGSTLFTASFAGYQTIWIGLFLGIVATIGYFLYYGFDPRTDKLNNIGDISAEFVLETLATARAKLSSIEKNMESIKDNKLNSKLKIAVDRAYEILQNIEEDPKDLRVARKFIIVYIDGIKKVTKSYTEMDEKEINSETKERLYSLLSDVEKRFDKELIRLKKNNQFDLDVHIDVLKEQIKN